MYIPKFKQTKPLYTSGGQLSYKDDRGSYVGYYVKTSKGRYYVNTNVGIPYYELEEVNTKLETAQDYVDKVRYDNLHADENIYDLRTSSMLPSFVHTTRASEFKRYFAKSKITNSITEISQETYTELTGQSSKYHWPSYNTLELTWNIGSPVADMKKGSYIIKGSETKNKEAVLAADKKMQGLAQLLTDYTQFV